jgi:CHAT domain-containing protein
MPRLDTWRLERLMRGDSKTGGWLGAYRAQDQEHQWLAAIDGLGGELWELLGEPMDRGLKERGLKPGARVAILPTASLGLLPLGIAQDPASGRRLGETWEIVQVPSFEALAAAATQAAKPLAPSLVGAINPTGNLAFAELEGALVAARFVRRPRLLLGPSNARADVVVAALKGASHWHFASHGAFDWNDVRRSGLIMRDGETLTVGQLIETQGSLGRPRLVVLSACETGLYDIGRDTDEFIGLPTTFLQVGATGVVGSLWQVDDLATALLMARFYDLHMGGLAPPTALKQAQIWLRDSNSADIKAYAEKEAVKAKIDRARLAELGRALETRRRSTSSRFAGIWEKLNTTPAAPQPKTGKPAPRAKAGPFQHPYWWAGFVYTGL